MSFQRVEQKQQQRYAVLRKVYEVTDGRPLASTNFREVAKDLDFAEDDARSAVDFLIEEGLLQWRGSGGGVSITHAGLVEVEASIKKPERETEHFTPSEFSLVLHQTFHGPVGAVQTGTTNTATVTQTIDTDVRSLIQQLHTQAEGLPEPKRSEAHESIKELEAASGAEKKNRPYIQFLLAQLTTLLVATLSSGAGGVLTELGKKLLP